MEDKLKEILESHQIRVADFCKQEAQLSAKIDFCNSHNLEEEKRIALLELQASSKILYRYKEMVEEITELLSNWNS